MASSNQRENEEYGLGYQNTLVSISLEFHDCCELIRAKLLFYFYFITWAFKNIIEI